MAKQTNLSQVISMTGFGKASCTSEGVNLEAEIRSVNHRFLDVVLRLPRVYNQFESYVRDLIGRSLQRGRVEVNVQRTATDTRSWSVQFNRPLFDAYYGLCEQVGTELGCLDASFKSSIVRDLLVRKEIVEIGDAIGDLEEEKKVLQNVVQQALQSLVAMRTDEGQRLGHDMQERVSALRTIKGQIVGEVSGAGEVVKARIMERLGKLAPELIIDEARVAMEAAMVADKVDVTEELVRLDSHFDQFEQTLRTPPNGRKLEFLLQEFGREFNTISSKAQSAAVQGLVVEAKSLLEQLREQALNVE